MLLRKIFVFFHGLFFSWKKLGGKNPHRMTDYELSKSRKKRKGGGNGRGMIKGLPKSSHYIANYFAKTGYSK